MQSAPIKTSTPSSVRGRLDHPVIDADGHQLECMPMVLSVLTDLAGKDVAARLINSDSTSWPMGTRPTPAGPRVRSFYGLLTENTLDRVAPTYPRLLYQRLEEIGFDFALLYPTFGLLVPMWPDDEVRVAAARAFNICSAEVYHGYRDKLEPVAIIPMVTPEEALAEIEYSVEALGLKAVMMSASIPRRIQVDGEPTTYVDTIFRDGPFDYEPVWEMCRRLRISPVFHGSATGWGTRCSQSNYVYNHIGSFATAQEGALRSLLLSGVPRRFPELRFSFLEGGVTWGAQLCVDLLSHYSKRNRDAIRQYDPARLDLDLARQLVTENAHGPLIPYSEEYLNELARAAASAPIDNLDDFADSGIAKPEDIVSIFSEQMFFGCESDDALSALAFQQKLLPDGLRLNALLASDIGHFDVPNFASVLPDAWKLVESGVMTEQDFRRFSFENVVRIFAEVNPEFFDGTSVQSATSATLQK